MTIYEGSYTTAATEDMIGNGTFTTPTDADRSDVESTAEVAVLMLHSWDTTIDTTQTAAAIRAIPLMSNKWATNQVEPERNGAQGKWLKPAENHAYSAPSIVPAPGDVSQDVADHKAIRAYDVSWRWISRDGTDLTTTGRQIVTIYLEKHGGQWDVVGHQFQDISLWHLCAALLSPMDPSQRHADTPCEDIFQSDLQTSWAAPEAPSEKR